MGWKGIAIGGWLGGIFGGPLGALFGAVLGHQAEARLNPKPRTRSRSRPAFFTVSNPDRALVFCASAAAMLAKMAKADGHVTADEIASVERAFARLGFSSSARDYAIRVFRQAKDDSHTIYQYAEEFSSAVNSVEICELFYEILWDVAAADGVLSDAERTILRTIVRPLGIRAAWYGFFANSHSSSQSPATSADELAAAYSVLGGSPSDSMDELQRKYRQLAKKNHPDALRAQGLPDELVAKATERMGRINSAWSTVRAARA